MREYTLPPSHTFRDVTVSGGVVALAFLTATSQGRLTFGVAAAAAAGAQALPLASVAPGAVGGSADGGTLPVGRRVEVDGCVRNPRNRSLWCPCHYHRHCLARTPRWSCASFHAPCYGVALGLFPLSHHHPERNFPCAHSAAEVVVRVMDVARIGSVVFVSVMTPTSAAVLVALHTGQLLGVIRPPAPDQVG